MIKIYSTLNYYGDDGWYYDKLSSANACGVYGIRINLCKFSDDKAYDVIQRVISIRNKVNKNIRIVIDIPYPNNKDRILDMNFSGIVKNNEIYHIIADRKLSRQQNLICVEQINSGLHKVGEILIYGDGEGGFEIIAVDGDRITVKALGTFEIGKTKSINLELIKCKVNAWKKTLTIEEPLDFLLSFVESADDVIELHKYIQNGGKVISKVETLKAMDNIEDIVKVSDGVLVARGDLGLCDSVGLYDNFNTIVNVCKKHNKTVLCATDILLSHTNLYIPSRSDIMDISHIISKGCKGIVLNNVNWDYEKTVCYINKIEQRYS